MTAQTASLIRTLWQGEKTSKLARDLHGTVIRKNNEISFNVQQDAQEFLLWLLHQFHEDLRDAGRRDRNVARNSFRKIKSLRKNYAFSPLPQSHIERLFGGNYCSTLVCPSCKKSKHSTDPFLPWLKMKHVNKNIM